jgi:hypothetical protein
MAARILERISMPDDETFTREYVFKRRPVIITDLFANDDIARITSLDQAMSAFEHVNLAIQPEYTSDAAGAKPRVVSFKEYWDLAHRSPDTPLMCSEQEIPARVMAQFRLPGVCRARDVDEAEVLSLPRRYGDHDIFANVFMGNRGNRSNLHYDGDHRHVLLYQVFGRKQVMLFEPEAGLMLKQLGTQRHLYGLPLDQMSEDEKLGLVERTDGYLDTIHPGETVFIPMLMWHYLEYTDDAMSFNVRFGRNKYGRFFSVDNFHRDYYVQNFSSKLCDPEACRALYEEHIARAVSEYLRPSASLRDKVKEVRSLFRELCTQVCPEARVEEYTPPDREDEEVDKVMTEITGTMRYAPPDVLARMRPVGPVSQSQRRQLDGEVLARAYPRGVQSRVFDNRIGKADVDQFTRAEAAQVMWYLRSPGSFW